MTIEKRAKEKERPAPTPQSRTKPAEVRLEELMASAQNLFLAKGVQATTISEIVEDAQVAKGTFYHYFESKNEMLAALAKRYTERFLEQLELAVDACAPDDWTARLRVWITANIETYLDTYPIHDIVYTNHHHHDRGNSEKNAILTQLLTILEGGAQAGAWPPHDLRLMAQLIYGGIHGATDDAIAGNAPDMPALTEAIVSASLRMLAVSVTTAPEHDDRDAAA